ncbi:GPI mannosyltransferase 3 [Entomortierella parvispora]|uniref:Mannosyltransferase n=1 Tax=Entomortierella parvispora TaxID=205924 RepID=A0A9P3HHZ4_9FUNG|nr:GPI mannosyltransferase 3 [Entomortierella parvispora]
MAILGLEDGALFIVGPRILQSGFAALGDLYAYKFSYRLFENQLIANWTLFLSAASWWNFFCSTRTLANSLESALTIVALYYWPFTNSQASTPTTPTSTVPSPRHGSESKEKKSVQNSLKTALMVASLTCIFRPTAAILWIFLGVFLLLNRFSKGSLKEVIAITLKVIFIGGVAVAGSAVLDTTLLYGRWILTPLNFVRVNVLEGISLFYGHSPWHWYISQGIPILFGIYIPLVLFGSWKAWGAPQSGLNTGLKQQVLYLCLWALVVYSSLQHKEWRFLYPILYPMLAFGGDALYTFSLSGIQGWRSSRKFVILVAVLVGVNAIMAWYTTFVHQRGVVDVMDWIREKSREGKIESVAFIMPCHSTPWYSNVHLKNREPLDMWFLTCEPPLGDINVSTYKDDSDIFYEDPAKYLSTRFASKTTRVYGNDGLTHPRHQEKDSHIVFFEDLVRTYPDTLAWFSNQGYVESVATQGQILSLTYGNEQILAYVQNGQNSAILALPLSNYPSPAPSPSKTYPAPAAYSGCNEAITVQSGYLGLSYYLACMNSPMESTPSQLFTIADVTAATTSATANVAASVIDPVNYTRNNYFIPLGADPNPFAWTGTQGLGLAGINRGHWEGPPMDPDITVPSELNMGSGGHDSSSSSSSSSLSTGAIVGIVVGALVVLGVVFWAMRKRNSDNGPGAENSSVPGKQELGLGAMVATKPTMTISPSSQMGTQVYDQGLGGGFNHGQFLAHSRPNVATSMADTSRQL